MKTTSILKQCSWLAAAFTLIGTAYSQELLLNPGFESDLAGASPPTSWTTRAGDQVKDEDGGLDDLVPRTGLLMYQIQGTQGNGASISQTVTLDAGDYLLSTFYAARSGFAGATDFTFGLLDASGSAILPASSTNPDLVLGEFTGLTRSYQALPAGDYTVTFEVAGSGLRQGTLDDFSLTPAAVVVDTQAPAPNPMLFEVLPVALSDTATTMTATTATDESGVEYFFTNLTFPDGSHDSGWQSSPTYQDLNLEPETEYTYTVRARDLSANLNETAESSEESATTLATPDNFLVNGGFEEDEDGASPPTGWTQVFGDQVKTAESGLPETGPFEGSNMFQIQATGGNFPSISQAVTLSSGDYDLSAYYGQRLNNQNAPSAINFNLIDSTGEIVPPTAFVDPVPDGTTYVQFTRNYTSLPAGSYTVTFEMESPGTIIQANVDAFTLVTATGGATEPCITSFTPVDTGVWEIELEALADTSYQFRSTTDLIFASGTLIENLSQGSDGDPGAINSADSSSVTTDSDGLARVRFSFTGDVLFIRAEASL